MRKSSHLLRETPNKWFWLRSQTMGWGCANRQFFGPALVPHCLKKHKLDTLFDMGHHFFPGRVFGEVSRQSLRARAGPGPGPGPYGPGPMGPMGPMGPYGPIWAHIGPYGPIRARAHGAHGSQTELFWRLALAKSHGPHGIFPNQLWKNAMGPMGPWGPWDFSRPPGPMGP